jgi:hypothetical protein
MAEIKLRDIDKDLEKLIDKYKVQFQELTASKTVAKIIYRYDQQNEELPKLRDELNLAERSNEMYAKAVEHYLQCEIALEAAKKHLKSISEKHFRDNS